MNVSLKSIVEENTTPLGKLFDLFIQCLIVISLVGYAFETVPTLGDGIRRWLRAVEIITVAIFSIEYLLRIFVADKR